MWLVGGGWWVVGGAGWVVGMWWLVGGGWWVPHMVCVYPERVLRLVCRVHD